MVARDDSVIRGSLIASLIFLVLSLALNFFLWRWGDTQTADAVRANERAATIQQEVQNLQSQATLMKAMLGVGNVSEAQFEQLAATAANNPDMELILQNFERDMTYLGPEADAASRNYPALPEFLVNAIRSRNEQYGQARQEATQIRSQADSDVEVARNAMKVAEDARDTADEKLRQEQDLFSKDREKMKLTTAETRDSLTRKTKEFDAFRRKSAGELLAMQKQEKQLTSTIETQRQELNRLRSDNFETTQGYVRYVLPDNKVVTINLGSGDSLRPGVTFGIIDGDETRLQDARVKATIQVTRILGSHRAEARVVAEPEIRYPIIPGDKIYSPFWAPGREVKIALAGNIDIDGDNQSDMDHVASMIRAAGAKVAAIIRPDGTEEGTLDSSVRFLVVGETPEAEDGGNAAEIAAMGRLKSKAVRLGVTVMPVWKLQAFLKTIDESLTTPLGTAVRGDDFPPAPSQAARSLPNNLPEIYKRQTEGMQQGNEILPP